MTPTIALELDGESANCLYADRDVLYVGTSWIDDDRRNHLLVLDRTTHAIRKRWKLPFLVSDLTVVGDTCYAALGPGDLVTFDQRGLGTNDPDIMRVDANAVRFATHDNMLFWGTAWGELHELERGRLAKVSKWLGSIAVDAERIYAGYDDGKVRVFRRDNGRREKLLAVGRKKATCALGTQLFTCDDDGVIKRWNATFEADPFGKHDVTGSTYGVVKLRAFGDWLASMSYERLCAHDRDGTLAFTFDQPGDESIYSAWLDDTALFVAVGKHVLRFERAQLGLH